MFWFQGEPPAGGGPEHLPRLRHAHRPRLILRGVRGEGVGSAPGGEIVVVVVVVAVNKPRENIYIFEVNVKTSASCVQRIFILRKTKLFFPLSCTLYISTALFQNHT